MNAIMPGRSNTSIVQGVSASRSEAVWGLRLGFIQKGAGATSLIRAKDDVGYWLFYAGIR